MCADSSCAVPGHPSSVLECVLWASTGLVTKDIKAGKPWPVAISTLQDLSGERRANKMPTVLQARGGGLLRKSDQAGFLL